MNVKIKSLVKYYDKKPILNIPSLEFNAYKTYCIRGRNGTGKTTLLKIIAQLLPYNEGNILYDEKEMTHDIMKEMTYISPNPYIFNTSVYQNIEYPLKLRNVESSEIQNRVNEYLTYFELSELKNQQAKKCSSGEKMKIALARGLIFQPKLLLIDEPTTNLDVESIEKLKDFLLKIKKNTTIIFISHDIHFIKSISDVELVLNDTSLELGE